MKNSTKVILYILCIFLLYVILYGIGYCFNEVILSGNSLSGDSIVEFLELPFWGFGVISTLIISVTAISFIVYFVSTIINTSYSYFSKFIDYRFPKEKLK